MTENILEGKGELLPVSCYLAGEYGASDVCIGVPAKLGSNGIEDIVEFELEDAERAAFLQSAEKLKSVVSELGI